MGDRRLGTEQYSFQILRERESEALVSAFGPSVIYPQVRPIIKTTYFWSGPVRF